MATISLDWAAVRRAYETEPETVRRLSARFGLAEGSIGRRARREGWVRCPDAPLFGAPADRERLANAAIAWRTRPAERPEAGRGSPSGRAGAPGDAAEAWRTGDTPSAACAPTAGAPPVSACQTGETAADDADQPADPAALVASLQRTTARLVAAAEARFAGGEGVPVEERDLRTLGALAAMLAKVISLDSEARTPRDREPPEPDPAAVDFDDPGQRDAFSLRLERLVEDGAAGGAGGADGA